MRIARRKSREKEAQEGSREDGAEIGVALLEELRNAAKRELLDIRRLRMLDVVQKMKESVAGNEGEAGGQRR
jgi:hypothetical protein